MVEMTFVWACECGHEQDCTREDQQAGAAYECSACKQVWGCVRNYHGGRVWVRISNSEVEFHQIIRRRTPLEEDEVE